MLSLKLFWRWTSRAITSTRGRACLDDGLRDRVTLADGQDGLTLSDGQLGAVVLADEVPAC